MGILVSDIGLVALFPHVFDVIDCIDPKGVQNGTVGSFEIDGDGDGTVTSDRRDILLHGPEGRSILITLNPDGTYEISAGEYC